MNLSDIRLPRQLEADGSAGTIQQALMARTALLWPGGDLSVPVISMSDPLKQVLRTYRLRGQVRCGFDSILDKLANERKGIANVRDRSDGPYGERVSRLLLCTNDGAERFYRHIEQLLHAHAPRVLGGLLDIGGGELGAAVTDKNGMIKVVMAEHKEAVSEILRAIVAET